MKRHRAPCLSSILKYAFTRYGMLWLGLGIVVLMSLAALLAPWLAPYDPTEFHRHAILKPPSTQYLLGTDAYGRDVLSRLLYGGRISPVSYTHL